jgi:hypothetical protein
MEHIPSTSNPAPQRTLNDLRVVHHDYAASGGRAAQTLRYLLIAVIVIAAGAGVAWKLKSDAAKNTTNSSALGAATGPAFPTTVPAEGVQAAARAVNLTGSAMPMVKLDEVKAATSLQQVARQRALPTSPSKARQSERATADEPSAAIRATPKPSSALAPAVSPSPEVQTPVVAPLVEERPVSLPAVAVPAAPTAEPTSQ